MRGLWRGASATLGSPKARQSSPGKPAWSPSNRFVSFLHIRHGASPSWGCAGVTLGGCLAWHKQGTNSRRAATCTVGLCVLCCSQAASWITWKRFWMTCRTASYHSFSQIAAQACQRARWTSKPSSMTSCSSPVTAAPARPWPPRNQQWGFHRAVSAPRLHTSTLSSGTPSVRQGGAGQLPVRAGGVWWWSAICGRPSSTRTGVVSLSHTLQVCVLRDVFRGTLKSNIPSCGNVWHRFWEGFGMERARAIFAMQVVPFWQLVQRKVQEKLL